MKEQMGTDEIRLPVILIAEDDDDDRVLMAKAIALAQIPADTRFVGDGAGFGVGNLGAGVVCILDGRGQRGGLEGPAE